MAAKPWISTAREAFWYALALILILLVFQNYGNLKPAEEVSYSSPMLWIVTPAR